MTKQELLEYYHIKPKSIKHKGMATIITTNDKKYVIKETKKEQDFFNYLSLRNFNNFPNIYSSNTDKIQLTDYIEDNNVPLVQRLEDLIYLTSILHTKTTFYKNVDDDYIKEIYENIINKLDQLYKYYNDIQDMIELEVYMSPANYLLIRNISSIYLSLRKSREYIEKWYSILKNEHRIRYAYIHGNLDSNHLIEGKDLYFISWDNSRIDLPIYDLEILYRNSFLDISLESLLEIYQLKYPLKEEELYLLLSLLLIPNKIDLKLAEYPKIKQVTNIVMYTDKIISYLENNTNKTDYNTPH